MQRRHCQRVLLPDSANVLRREDRCQRLYVIGKTGTGKTTLLRSLILRDIEAGKGVGVIDPLGDLAQDLLEHIPPWRTKHVVYFDPADVEWPPAFNLLGRQPGRHGASPRRGL